MVIILKFQVGGHDSDSNSIVNGVMAFDISVQNWQRVASMSSKRSYPGVCVLNNILYAVNRYLIHY